jgi:hypothetical protein
MQGCGWWQDVSGVPAKKKSKGSGQVTFPCASKWLLHLPYTPPSSLLRAPTFVRLLKPLHAFALLFVSK